MQLGLPPAATAPSPVGNGSVGPMSVAPSMVAPVDRLVGQLPTPGLCKGAPPALLRSGEDAHMHPNPQLGSVAPPPAFPATRRLAVGALLPPPGPTHPTHPSSPVAESRQQPESAPLILSVPGGMLPGGMLHGGMPPEQRPSDRAVCISPSAPPAGSGPSLAPPSYEDVVPSYADLFGGASQGAAAIAAPPPAYMQLGTTSTGTSGADSSKSACAWPEALQVRGTTVLHHRAASSS